MKYSILIAVMFVVGCGGKTGKKSVVVNCNSAKQEYHIRVVRHLEESENYRVEFTKNGWCDVEELVEILDMTFFYYGERKIVKQVLLNNIDSVILIAKKLKSYSDCIRFNDSVTKKYSLMLAEIADLERRIDSIEKPKQIINIY